MNNNQSINKETSTSAVQPKSNNNLLIVLGILIAIIIGMIFYVRSTDSSPSSLVDETSYHEDGELMANNDRIDSDSTNSNSSVEQAKPKAAYTPKDIDAAGAKRSSKEHIHTVKPGDNIFNIAQRYNFPQQELKKLSNLKDNNLKAEQQIRIKITAMREVQSGEGILAIAKKYNVEKELILKANNLTSENLQLNQRLIIPLP